MAKIIVENSFCTLENFPEKVENQVRKLLSYDDYEVEQQIKSSIFKLRYAKKINNKRMVYAIRGNLKKLYDQKHVCWFGEDHTFPTGHLPIVKDLLKRMRFNDYEIEDQRVLPQNPIMLRWRNEPPDPRYYQKEMRDLAVDHERGVLEAAVGTGKTLVIALIIKEFSCKSLVIVPSRPLMSQIQQELAHYFGESKVETIDTAKVKKGKELAPIRITTVDTLRALGKNGWLERAISDIDLVNIDEIHHAGAKTYTDLIPAFNHVYYRFGTTGTFLRNDSKTLDMWGFLSNRLYTYTAKQAIKDGYLTPVDMKIISLKGKAKKKYDEEYTQNYCNPKVVISGVCDLLKNEIPSEEQVLILVKRTDEGGKVLHEVLDKLGFENTYIHGESSKEEQDQAISDFNDRKIRILIGSSVIGEGINVKSTQHLILANGGKSPIQMGQGLGRVARLSPEKTHGRVYDFHIDGTNYLCKHTAERIQVFEESFDGEVEWQNM